MRGWIEHLVAACRWSASGIYILFTEEEAARMEIVGAVLGLIWLCVIGRSFTELGFYVILCLASFSIEALNTAIEGMIDHLSPERTDFGRRAKDLGSAAVFFMLSATGLYWLVLTIATFMR